MYFTQEKRNLHFSNADINLLACTDTQFIHTAAAAEQVAQLFC